MAHYQQLNFIEIFNKNFFKNQKISVLEIGSFPDQIRYLFKNAEEYVGMDLKKGPGVDLIYDGKNIKLDNKNQKFDLCISSECFEHNPYYLETFKQMTNYANDDGIVVFTCASLGRPEHGTKACDPNSSPFSAEQFDYYKNLSSVDFNEVVKNNFYKYVFYKNSVSKDLYFVGIKSKKYEENFHQFEKNIFSVNSLVIKIERDTKEKIKNFIKYLINDILPYLAGDILTRKIQIYLKKFLFTNKKDI